MGTLVAVTITLLVVFLTRPEPVEAAEQQTGISVDRELDITEVVIPDEFRAIWNEKWYPYRPQLAQWSREQVNRYWEDPVDMFLDYMEKENRKLIEDIFADVQ